VLLDLNRSASIAPVYTGEVCAFGNLWNKEFREEHGSESVHLFTIKLVINGIREFLISSKIFKLKGDNQQ
jgi:hypothetical protein